MIEIRSFFKMRAKPEVSRLSDGKSPMTMCGAYDVAGTSKTPFYTKNE